MKQMTHDRPLAAAGLVSYRYNGPFGFIMIGAANIGDALNEANRSLCSGGAVMENLEIWNVFENRYEKALV
jgi:hypothetical protein